MDDFLTILGVVLVAGALVMGVILYVTRGRGGEGVSATRPAPPHALSPESLRDTYGRPAFVPTTVEPDPERQPPTRSQFAGRPWLPEGDGWPTCGVCGKPLQLLLQLDLDALPNGAPPQRSGGLAQLFYCVQSEGNCEARAFQTGALAVVARVVDGGGPGGRAPKDLAPDALPTHWITGWEEVDDLPQATELEHLGVVMTGEVLAKVQDDPSFTARAGDKLGGWPEWVQGVDYPACPDCGKRMEFLFQLASDDHLAHGFSDAGTGHLTRCRTHSTRLAFGWAST